MPSWLTPITSDMFSIARSVVRASREPSSARGSIWVRRAETRANSAATKNALPSSRTSASRTDVVVLIASSPSSRRPRPSAPSSSAQREPVDAQAVHVLDGEHRELLPLGLVGVGAVGDRDLGDVTARRARGRAPAARARRWCRSPRGRAARCRSRSSTSSGRSRPESDPRAVGTPAPAGAEPVVLVGDVADDLLDHVLDGHDAGLVAVLVEHDGELDPPARSSVEQRVEAQRVGHHDRPGHQVLDLGGVRARGSGRATACLTCTVPIDVVVVVEHREPRVAGLRGPAR